LLLFDIGNKSLALPQVRSPRIGDGYPHPAALRRLIIGRLRQIDNAATIAGLVINGQSRAVQLNSDWFGNQCDQAAYNCASDWARDPEKIGHVKAYRPLGGQP